MVMARSWGGSGSTPDEILPGSAWATSTAMASRIWRWPIGLPPRFRCCRARVTGRSWPDRTSVRVRRPRKPSWPTSTATANSTSRSPTISRRRSPCSSTPRSSRGPRLRRSTLPPERTRDRSRSRSARRPAARPSTTRSTAACRRPLRRSTPVRSPSRKPRPSGRSRRRAGWRTALWPLRPTRFACGWRRRRSARLAEPTSGRRR